MANRAVRRKREAALAKAEKLAANAVEVLKGTPENHVMYHERRVRAEALTGAVGLMRTKMEEDL